MKFLDYDNDGWNDTLQLNGAMLDKLQLYHSEVSYKEQLLMFRNPGKGHFDKASETLGPDFMRRSAGRGLVATADYDNDGDIDIATNNCGDFPSLLRNDGGMGYKSASDPRIHFGLGGSTMIDSLEIIWPSGLVQKLSDISADQIIAVKESVGIVPHKFPRIGAAK